MKLAIVGSVCLAGNVKACEIIDHVIDQHRPSEIVSGGALGIDTMAAEIARYRGIQVKIFPPKKPRWYYYKKRNLLIAEYCDALIRIISSKSTTYGSGWTRDRAREMGKPTEEFVIYET